MKVSEVMTKEVITARPDTTVGEAQSLLYRHHISAMPIVDERGRVLGMVSEGDMMRALMLTYSEIDSESTHYDFEQMEKRAAWVRGRPVGEIMSKRVISVSGDAPVLKAAALMLVHQVKRLVVLSEERLAGVISRADICQAVLGAKD